MTRYNYLCERHAFQTITLHELRALKGIKIRSQRLYWLRHKSEKRAMQRRQGEFEALFARLGIVWPSQAARP